MKSGVYQIKNIVNGKRYIGSSSDLQARRRYHFGRLRRGVHSNAYLQHSFDKYGEKAFVFEILEFVEIDKLLISEQKLLDTNPEYNLVMIAGPMFRLGSKNSPEHRAKISKALTGKPGRKGWNHSEASIEKMRGIAIKLGRRPLPKTPEQLKKIGIRSSEWHRNMTPEQKEKFYKKISESHRMPDRTTKCVICNSTISYRPCGKYIPKTCNKRCRSELRRINLKKRIDANPEANRKASLKRWSNYTVEQRLAFGKTIGDKSRKPKIEAYCEICNKHFSYSSRGKQKLRTCSPECLSELRRINLKKRTDSNPEANRQASLKRWNQTHSSSSDI